MDLYMLIGYYEYDPWAGRAEKSAAAKRRERQANDGFDTIRKKFERTEQANKEAIVRLGCKPESESMLKCVPEITLVHILQFARPENYLCEREKEASRRNAAAAAASSDGHIHSNPSHLISSADANDKEMAAAARGSFASPSASSAAAATTSSSPAARSPSSKRNSKVLYKDNASDEQVETKVTAAEASPSDPSSVRPAFGSLHEPGKKHTFHLLNPDVHLTGPCWRDFSRYVRSFDGWNVKRIQATPEERKTYRFTKKGKAYFIKVIHTNPGTASKPKKKAANKRAAATNQDTVVAKNEPGIDSKPPAKKKAKTTA